MFVFLGRAGLYKILFVYYDDFTLISKDWLLDFLCNQGTEWVTRIDIMDSKT
jgi:hypothetical protein